MQNESRFRQTFFQFIDGETIEIPTQFDYFNIPDIPRSQVPDWQNLANLYSLVGDAAIDPYDQQAADYSNEQIMIGLSLNVVDDNTGPRSETNSISLDKMTMAPGDLLTVTASLKGKTTGQECFLYVGDGNGTYYKQDHNTGCVLKWQSTATTLVGWHTVGVTLTDVGSTIAGTAASPGSLPSPFISEVVNVCNGTCSPVPAIGLSVNPTAVKLPASGGNVTPVNISATVSNPTSPTLSGKECYIYIGDGAGGWILKTRKSLSSCSFQWDYSGSSVNSHGFIANIQDAGQSFGNPNAEPKSAIRYVRVCAANASTCTAPNQPSDPNDPANPNTPTIPTETFNPTVSGNRLLGLAGLKPNLKTVEGIFDFLLANIFPILIGILAFISISVGGIEIMSSAGDPTKAAKGKKAIIYGVIGIFVAIFSYIIITLVIAELKKAGLA